MLGKFDEAIGNYRSIIKESKSPAVAARAQFELAGAYDSRNDFKTARREYDKVPALYPDESRWVALTEYATGMTFYREALMNTDSSGLSQEASDALQKFVSDHPKDRHVPHALMALADLYAMQGDYKGAASAYTQVIDFDSSLIPLKPRAVKRSNDVRAHRDLVRHARVLRADVLRTKLERPEEALAEYRTVLSGDPANGAARLGEAMCCIDLGLKDEARESLEVLVRQDGDLKDVASNLLQTISPDTTARGGK